MCLKLCGMYWVFSVCGRIDKWRRRMNHGRKRVKQQPKMRQGSHQMTTLICFAKMTMDFLSQANLVFGARLWTNCSAQMCLENLCPVYTHPVDFLEFIPANRNHHHFSDDVEYNELQLVCHWEICTAKLKMKTLPASVVPPSNFPINMVIEAFSSFELLILSLTLLMFWTYRSQR